MTLARRTVLMGAMWMAGCAAAPETPRTPVGANDAWPATVTDTCPQRRVYPECFGTPGIDRAMRSLMQRFARCYRPDSAPLRLMLTVETHGGRPRCVQYAPRQRPMARCVAAAVARHLRIAGGDPRETCRFRYPLRFVPARP